MEYKERKNTTIGWVRQNGETIEDREFADQKYYELILNLWAEYVNYSGDTYYPPLQNELYLDYQIFEEENS